MQCLWRHFAFDQCMVELELRRRQTTPRTDDLTYDLDWLVSRVPSLTIRL